MIELGKYQVLEVVKKAEFGLYLSEPEGDKNTRVLLPGKEVPEGTITGDQLNVFIYKDSEDRIIATTAQVPVTLGGLAVLTVKEVSPIGAFLEWGLMKDLLLPYKEQTVKVKEGDPVLVTLYVDKSKRLCASMKIYESLSTDSPYHKDELVTGMVYDCIEAFGVFVAVDNRYSGMIPKNELYSEVKVGDTIQARVINVREDGKMTLSVRERSYKQMGSDSEMILTRLKASGGFLPFNDSSLPEDIKEEFKLSKNAFKRAIGKLYKEGAIIITDQGIRLS